MTNLDSIFKSRDITLPTKVCLVKAIVFPVVMYGCESWTIKKTECWRTDAFELEKTETPLDDKESWVQKNLYFWTVVLEEMLESPLDCKEILLVNPKRNQPWIILGKTDAEAKTPNTLATWCEELTLWKRPWCWGRLKAGGEGDDKGWDGWMASLTQWTWVWASSGNWWWTRKPGVLEFMGSQSLTRLSNWTEQNHVLKKLSIEQKLLPVLHSVLVL